MKFQIATLMSVLAASSHAALVINPTGVTSSVAVNSGNDPSDLNAGTSLTNAALWDTGDTVDATALAVTHTATFGSNYLTTAPTVGDYFTSGSPSPLLTFTLGSTFNDVDSIVLWNYTPGGGSGYNSGVQTFSLAFYDATNTIQIGSTLTGLSITRTASGSASTAQQIFFGSGVNFDGVGVVRMTVTDNYFGASGGTGGDRVGLAEVRFTQVPEPSAALLGGLGILGLLRRRRG